MPDLNELEELLVLLREHGVLAFRSGDVEVTLGPPAVSYPPEALGEVEEGTGWRGYTKAELRDLGAE